MLWIVEHCHWPGSNFSTELKIPLKFSFFFFSFTQMRFSLLWITKVSSCFFSSFVYHFVLFLFFFYHVRSCRVKGHKNKNNKTQRSQFSTCSFFLLRLRVWRQKEKERWLCKPVKKLLPSIFIGFFRKHITACIRAYSNTRSSSNSRIDRGSVECFNIAKDSWNLFIIFSQLGRLFDWNSTMNTSGKTGSDLSQPNIPKDMYVKLVSADEHEFYIKRDLALTSQTIKAMLSGPGQCKHLAPPSLWPQF